MSRWKKASGNIQLTEWHCSKLVVLLESGVAAFLQLGGWVVIKNKNLKRE